MFQLHIHDFLNMNNYVVKDTLGGKASKLFPGFLSSSLRKQIVKLLFFIAWLQYKKEEKSYYRWK